MNIQVEIEKLIQRYLAGETSEQESLQMQEWLQASEENRQLFASHKKLWLNAGALAGYNSDQVRRSKETVDLKIRNSETQQSLERAKMRIRILAYAALVFLLLGIASIMYILQKDTSVKQGEILAGGKIEVPYGSKILVTLPDGSKVWVNAGSEISYPSDFGVTSRNVYLTGEAYFDVAKMEKIPFYVNTDVVKIKVFGTAFNVKAYSDDEGVETTLDRGAISITCNGTPDREINVKPKQKITILRDAQKPPISSKVKNTDAITAWKDNRLVFEQEPLWSLAKQLERRYNVQIRFNSEKIKSLRFTAAIKEMPIEQVLKAISLSSPISYSITGSEIILMENKKFIQ